MNLVIISSYSPANLNSLFTTNSNNSVNMTFFCKLQGSLNYLCFRAFCKLSKNEAFNFTVN